LTAFDFKVCNSANRKKIQNCHVVSNNIEFDLVSNPLEELQKTCKESYQQKNDRKMMFLTSISVCKGFRPITIFGSPVLHFFSTQHQIFPKHFYILYWHFLLILKPNADKTAQKMKYIFINVS